MLAELGLSELGDEVGPPLPPGWVTAGGVSQPGVATGTPLTTPAAIKAYSDAIYGSASSAAKTAFEIQAMLKNKQGQPIVVPTQSNIPWPWIIGGVVAVGVLAVMMKK